MSREEGLKKNLQEFSGIKSTLIAVSKTKPKSDIELLHSLGHKDFGENKVQELEEKAIALEALDINWHFIGNLQSNKVSKLLNVPNLKMIHSVSSLKLATEISKRADRHIKIFLQINTSGEDQKGGFETSEIEEINEAAHAISRNSNLEFYGLMTIGSIRTDDFEKSARESFQLLKTIRDKLNRPDLKLSMGMSADYKIALEEGADFIRVGSTIFGAR